MTRLRRHVPSEHGPTITRIRRSENASSVARYHSLSGSSSSSCRTGRQLCRRHTHTHNGDNTSDGTRCPVIIKKASDHPAEFRETLFGSRTRIFIRRARRRRRFVRFGLKMFVRRRQQYAIWHVFRNDRLPALGRANIYKRVVRGFPTCKSRQAERLLSDSRRPRSELQYAFGDRKPRRRERVSRTLFRSDERRSRANEYDRQSV